MERDEAPGQERKVQKDRSSERKEDMDTPTQEQPFGKEDRRWKQLDRGFENGYEEGFEEGYGRGLNEGLARGYSEGRNNRGYWEGLEEAAESNVD